MQILEKILEEIEEARQEPLFRLCDYSYKDRHERIINRIEDIIRSHMDDDGWIPCEEQMPEEGELVLIQIEKANWKTADYEIFLYIAELDGYGEWVTERGVPNGRVTAWMPMPEPYKEQKTYGSDH